VNIARPISTVNGPIRAVGPQVKVGYYLRHVVSPGLKMFEWRRVCLF